MFGYKLVRTKDYNRLIDDQRKLSILGDWIYNSSHRKLATTIRDLVKGIICVELTDMLITTYNDVNRIEKERQKKTEYTSPMGK